MKNTVIGFVISTVLLAACQKYQTGPGNDGQPSMVGKWNVDNVTTYFYDSTGLREMGVHVYPAGAPDYPYHLEINSGYSWIESLHMPADSDYIAATGTYTITSDSTFTLKYVTAVPGREIEPCKILSLTSTSFVFSKQLTTVFNGTEPGYIKYVYKLTRL